MKKVHKYKAKRIINFILITALGIPVLGSGIDNSTFTASATTISEVQQQINDTQNEINNINDKIGTLSEEQDLLEEKIDDLNAEIINMMTSINLLEEQLEENEANLNDKQSQIDEAEAAYHEAKASEEKQYDDMVIRIRYMYENGTDTYLSLFLTGEGLGDMLNHMDYVEKIYAYDRSKLEEYRATKQAVSDLWDQLEIEKADLEEKKAKIEADEAALLEQKENLDVLLAQKKRESANYDAEIKKYQQEAAVAKKKLQQEQQALKKLQEQQNQGNTSAANGTYKPTSYTTIIDNATGSDLGKKVAKYACQFIGNPYVLGGTSLTNGADCSGFTYRVYSDFGYNLPRTSYQQRSAGVGVEYSNAQPGDLICYDGHVALYIGGGKIVHASSVKTGIKVSNAEYRTILAVRRIIN